MATFEISQIEGPRRRLVLRGWAAPLAGVAWPVRQRGETRWTRSGGVGHAVGPQVMPSEFEFAWRPSQLQASEVATLDGRQIRDPYTLQAAVSQMVVDGASVVVTWQGRPRPGLLREFTPVEGTAAAGWTATLEVDWLQPARRIPTPPPGFDARSSYDKLLSGFRKLTEALTFPARIVSGYATDVRAGVAEVHRAFRRLRGVASTYQTAVRDVAGIPGRAGAALGELISQVDALDELADKPIDALVDDAEDPDAERYLQTTRARAKAVRAARLVRRQAILDRVRLVARRSNVLGTHKGVDGDDARMLALRYYGRLDVAEALARYNGLDGYEVPSGLQIVLPRLRVLLDRREALR